MTQVLERLARSYIAIRDSGETGEVRSLAHDALMNELREAGVAFEDREHAARIARAIVTLAEVGLWPPTPPRGA
jgi:hypothetical protein